MSYEVQALFLPGRMVCSWQVKLVKRGEQGMKRERVMKLKTGIAMGLILGCSAFAETVAEESVVADAKAVVIDSTFAAREILWDAQEMLVDISPPQKAVFNFLDATIYAVDWLDMPSELKRRMPATMVYGFPVYELRMETDPILRETIFRNARGVEVYRLAPPSFAKYDPYAYLKEKFSVSSFLEIDEWSRWIFDWAHTSCTIQMVPKTLHADFLDELAYQESQEQPVALPMMMAMGASGISKPMAHMTQGTNGVVLEISLPVGFGRYAEIFRRENLDSSYWVVAESWLPTFSRTNMTWVDTIDANKYFYHISNAVDSDGDGFSDLREAWGSPVTDSNVFNAVNDDGDSMHQWWELKMFGHTNQTDITDFDQDGLLDIEEMIYFTGSPPTNILISDPSIYDTDDDGLNDFDEVRGNPPTDPWNPDVSSPALIVSPASGTVITP